MQQYKLVGSCVFLFTEGILNIFRLYGLDRNMDIDFFLRDIAFFDGTCVSCTTRCSVTINCSNDFDFIVYNVSTLA